MSLWSREELRIVLQPGRAGLDRVRRLPAWSGRREEILTSHWLDCESADKSRPWQAALHALAGVLPEHAGARGPATVILSNHLVRYALVPWSAELSDAEEEMAFVRHSFVRIYGDAALQWQFRLSHGAARLPRIASAVDGELLDGLRGTFSAAGITLRSVQPNLMMAVNSFKRRLRGMSAWFALVEPGYLCLALLQNGRWSRVRGIRVGANWALELGLLLERETLLLEGDAPPDVLHLWQQVPAGAAGPVPGHWQTHAISQGPLAFDTPGAAPLATGMAG